MREQVMDLVRRELAAFLRRGGDDLVAEWGADTLPEDYGVIELRHAVTGEKHEVFVQESEGTYSLKVGDYGVSSVLGIRCAAREDVIDAGEFDLRYDFDSKAGLRHLARHLGRVLDENKGRFEPQREYGVALSSDARYVLGSIEKGLPQDGSVTLACNVDPSSGSREDEILFFVGPDREPIDLWLRMGTRGVTAYDTNGLIGRFEGTRIRDDLRELVRESVAAIGTVPRR